MAERAGRFCPGSRLPSRGQSGRATPRIRTNLDGTQLVAPALCRPRRTDGHGVRPSTATIGRTTALQVRPYDPPPPRNALTQTALPNGHAGQGGLLFRYWHRAAAQNPAAPFRRRVVPGHDDCRVTDEHVRAALVAALASHRVAKRWPVHAPAPTQKTKSSVGAGINPTYPHRVAELASPRYPPAADTERSTRHPR